MRTIEIPKKSGGTRTIAVQYRRERKANQALAWRLTQFFLAHESPGIAHGFLPGRNCATNAATHAAGCPKWVLNMDLADFFATVTAHHLAAAGVPAELIAALPHDPVQGLSYSPAAANCASLPMDAQLARECAARGLTVTRYADDITISGADRDAVWNHGREIIRASAHAAGFTVNEKKTRLCDARFGRPTVTGIALCPDGTIAPTRRASRRAKSAAHDAKTKPTPRRKRIARGCAEWCELRRPDPAKMSTCEMAAASDLLARL